jgi:phosphonate ABC transporter substrate-binding protein
MSEDKKKYRISDPDGFKLVLNSISKNSHKDEEPEKVDPSINIRKIRRRTISIVAFAVVFLSSLGYLAFNLVQSYRSEEIQIRGLIEEVAHYEDHARKGNSVAMKFDKSMKLGDSLLTEIDEMMVKFPDQDTLKTMWASVLVHKYEKYVHYSLKSSLYANIQSIDTNLLNRAKKYNPKYTNILPILAYIPDFYEYREIYKDPPVLSRNAPKQWDINELAVKADRMIQVLDSNQMTVEVHFPVLFKWVQYLSNTVLPEIMQWRDFWKQYKKAISGDVDEVSKQKILRELRREYPSLDIFKSSADDLLNSGLSISMGLSKSTVIPVGRNVHEEMKPLQEYFYSKFNIELEIQEFDNYFELYTALDKQQVDFAVFDLVVSTIANNEKVGLPVAQRVWNRQRYLNNTLYSIDKKITSPNDLYDKKIALLDPDLFYTINFIIENKLDATKIYPNITMVSSLDSLMWMLETDRAEITSLSEEELYYAENNKIFRKKLLPAFDYYKLPLEVLWAREGLSARIISEIQDIMIPMLPSDVYKFSAKPSRNHTFSDWDPFENKSLHKYFNETQKILIEFNLNMNRLHIMPITGISDSATVSLRGALNNFLVREGFDAIHHDEMRKNTLHIGEKYITLLTRKTDDGKLNYDIQVRKKDRDSSNEDKLLYHENFNLDYDNFPPDFGHKLFDLADYLDIYGKVTRVDDTTAQILMHVPRKSADLQTVNLYEELSKGSYDEEAFATCQVIKIVNNLVTIRLNDDASRMIKIGDLAEIKNESKD